MCQKRNARSCVQVQSGHNETRISCEPRKVCGCFAEPGVVTDDCSDEKGCK